MGIPGKNARGNERRRNVSKHELETIKQKTHLNIQETLEIHRKKTRGREVERSRERKRQVQRKRNKNMYEVDR